MKSTRDAPPTLASNHFSPLLNGKGSHTQVVVGMGFSLGRTDDAFAPVDDGPEPRFQLPPLEMEKTPASSLEDNSYGGGEVFWIYRDR